MKINQQNLVSTQMSAGSKKKVKKGPEGPQDGFVKSSAVEGEVSVPKNMVIKAAGNLKENEELHTPTTMEIAGETAGKLGGIVGGAVGLVGVGAGLYAGGLGGMVTGGAMGLGFGPAKAIVTGQVGFDIVKSVFHTTGAMGKIGLVAGAAAATVGAGALGYKLGKTIGLIPGYAIGIPVGLASSKDPVIVEKTEPKRKRKIGKLAKGLAGVTGGATAIAGGVGGGIIGAGIGTAGATVSGLLLKDLSLAALGQSGLVGAAIGGGVMAIAAGYGGYKLVEWSAQALGSGKDAAENIIDSVKDNNNNNNEVQG